MADVATEENEGAGGCSDESGDVACGVTGDVEDVEALVAEVVMGLELPDLQVVFEGHFDDIAALEICLVEWGVFLCWIAWQECLLEARADDKIARLRQRVDVPAVVEMPVRKHECFDFRDVDITARQDIQDVLLYSKSWDMVGD